MSIVHSKDFNFFIHEVLAKPITYFILLINIQLQMYC